MHFESHSKWETQDLNCSPFDYKTYELSNLAYCEMLSFVKDYICNPSLQEY